MGPGRMGDSLSIYESIGNGKVFKSPIDFTKTQRLLICDNAKCKPKDVANQRKCAYCLKVFCFEGKSLKDGKSSCGQHNCTNYSSTAKWCTANIKTVNQNLRLTNGHLRPFLANFRHLHI